MLESRALPGAVAQLGERRVRNAKVEGSIPFRSTIFHCMSSSRSSAQAAGLGTPPAFLELALTIQVDLSTRFTYRVAQATYAVTGRSSASYPQCRDSIEAE